MLVTAAALVCSALLSAPVPCSPDNYAAEVLRERDGVVIRWNRSPDQPIRVFLSMPQGSHGGDSEAPRRRVRAAFRAWESAAPVRFEFVDDSAFAEARVRFVERLVDPERGGNINGLTRWTVDDSSRIVGATITLALQRGNGRPLRPNAIEAIALHEVGHLLGLSHTLRRLHIMSPMVEVRGLSVADRETARLLYALPTGVLRP